MLDHQSSVSIDMRQLIWESFFIYSNPGKIKTTQKISTHELIFFGWWWTHFWSSPLHKNWLDAKLLNCIIIKGHWKSICYKETKLTFSQHSHSQDMNQKFESALRILKFVYSQWTIYSYYELLKFQQIQICNLQPAT